MLSACAAVKDGAIPAKPGFASVVLKNADFAMEPVPGRACPPLWGCTMHADPASFRFSLEADPRSGVKYLKVERVKNEPWAIASQVVPAEGLQGKRLRLAAAVQSEGIDGKGAGPLLIIQGPGGRTLAEAQRLVQRSTGWQEVAVELDVVPGAQLVEVGLYLEGGGIVHFGEVRLEILGPATARQ